MSEVQAARAELGDVPIFQGLAPDALQDVARRIRIAKFEEGQWIVAHGETDREVYVILKGRVRVLLFGETRELILSDLEAGAMFGDMSAIDDAPRSASVVALGDVTVARISAETFLDLITRHPSVCRAVLKILVSRIRQLDARIHEFASYTVAQRLRAELLRLSVPIPGRPQAAVVTPNLTHAELAARIGTHREAVTRELGTLARSGAVVKEKGALVVKNVLALTVGLEP